MIGSNLRNGPKGPPRQFTGADADKFLRRGYQALMERNFKDAGACCGLVLKYMPKAVGAHFLAGLIALETADWPTANKAFKSVVALDENHAAAWAQLARVFMQMGQYNNADTALERAIALQPEDPLVQDVIGTVLSLLGDQDDALMWFDKAASKSPNASFELSRAKALTFLGRLDEAKIALKKVVGEHPRAAQAHLMLSRVEKVKDRAHLTSMETLVQGEPEGSPNIPFFEYAIGKELEDLEEWEQAFYHYKRGAEARRKEVNFDEAAEISMFSALQETFHRDWLSEAKAGLDDRSPIFIVGQPRTGTTLIERIITAHSDVQSAGELQQFGMAVKRITGLSSRGPISAEIVKAAGAIDPAKVAELYLETTRRVRPDSPRFVDKLPVNYLHAPLIAAAFPNAKIIHVVREPMDSCFASYKQLFADAYYHSYDQEEMARHHMRYRDLMDHWRPVLGDRMHEVHYEHTVENIEENARKLIDFLELEWQDACLDFHKQDTAVTTASAAQVREQAHTRSVGRWKMFEEFLGPMKSALERAGQ